MILQVDDNRGVLEIFWRHPVSRNPNRSAVASFLAGLTHRSEVAEALRAYSAAASRSGSPHEFAAMLKPLVDDVVLRKIVLLRHRSEVRWGGTRNPVARLNSSLLLLRNSSTHPVRNVDIAVQWFRQAEADEAQDVWQRLWLAYGRASGPLSSQTEFTSAAEHLIVTGELVPLFHPFAQGAAAVVASDPVLPAPASQPAEAPAAEPEPVTFSSDHDSGAQVRALVDAAEKGTPFCEECAKAGAGKRAA